MDDLRADCRSCAGLCCVAPAFAASSDFAVDKPAGQPCANLQPDFRCGIHADLRERGFAGCTVFDCFGAGQQVTRVTFSGRDWRRDPGIAGSMFTSFAVMRPLHELLWYLADALSRPEAEHADLAQARDRTEHLTRSSPHELAVLDMDALRAEINVLLLRTSELVRAPDLAAPRTRRSTPAGRDDAPRAARSAPGPRRRAGPLRSGDLRATDLRATDLRGADLRGADLVGKDLAGTDLRGASLRGASLIGANLTGTDLRRADLIGADLRGTNLGGADLTDALFLTRFQVNGALGDHATRLPPAVERPPHWA